jgi:hypothetical protein
MMYCPQWPVIGADGQYLVTVTGRVVLGPRLEPEHAITHRLYSGALTVLPSLLKYNRVTLTTVLVSTAV